MGRKFILGAALLGVAAMAGCGGGTGISNPPNNGTSGGGATSSTLTASQSAVNFGSTALNATQGGAVVLTNSSAAGGAKINISKLTISGAGFSIAPAITLPVSLSAGQSLTVGMNFTPATSGSATGSLVVASDATFASMTISLSGVGLGSNQLGVNPATLAFGDVNLGSTAQLTGSLAAGSSDITVSSIAWTGTGYSISGISFPATVPAGQSVSYTVTFAPSSAGSLPGTLSFVSNASNSPAVENLTGAGVQSGGPPQPSTLTVSPSSLDFSNVFLGSTKQLAGSLTAGTSDVSVTSIAWTGQGYSISGISFPATVPAGQSVPYTVTFAPTTVGSSPGTLSFVSNASNSPGAQTLTGTGVHPGPPPGAISAGFFGMDVGNNNSPWPSDLGVKAGFFRSLGAQMRWSDVEPSCDGGSDPNNACYNWTSFDQWASQATASGQEILYTAFYTPAWVSSNPTATCQYVSGNSQSPPPGGCYPPVDVETGDRHWKDYLTAVYMHAATTPGLEKIKYWECWNEPNVPTEYSNNNSNNALSDLNIMCSDLKATIHALDPTTKFTTPAPTLGPGVITWQKAWINAGYANYADYIGYHGYVCNNPATCSPSSAELEQTAILGPLQSFIASTKGTANDVTGKLLWDTEGSDDAGGTALADPDQHAAFYARFTLLQQSAGVAEFSYWGWDYGGGDSLINNPGNSNAALNEAGVAWQQIYNWTVGSAFQTPCANTSGTVWQCTLTNGISTSLFVWDTAQTCSSGVCTTSNFNAPAQYTKYLDLAGNSTAIVGGVVPIGAKPVLLQ